jgi:hypothetical protein
MNKLTSSVLGLSAAIIGGVVYFLTPQFGIDYTKKPSLPAVLLTERIVLPKSAKSELTWQNNLDKAINPNPTLMDHIFPYSLCNQVTYEKSISTITHRKTSNKPELRAYLQDQIGITNQLKKTDIDLPKSYFPLATSCEKPLEHKILTAEVQYQGLASDDNSDRGSDSIFSPDDVNLSVAVKRDKKITKEIIQLTKTQPDVKITALPPSESNLSQDNIKLLLRKQYPLGTDFERQEIMSAISMLDRKMMTNNELSDIVALHRGVRISVLQKIQTQQVITFPAPIGLSPLLLLVPTVRVASFSFVRVVVTSCIYILNSIARLGLFIIGQLIRILYAALRLLVRLLKKLKKIASKLAIKSLRFTAKLLVLTYNKLVQLISKNRNETNLTPNTNQNITAKDTNGFKVMILKTSSFYYLLANNIIVKTQCFSDLFIYNTCAVITRKPQGQEFEKTYTLPTVKVVILFKKSDPYNNLTYYTRLPKNKPDSVYETEKLLVQIQKR